MKIYITLCGAEIRDPPLETARWIRTALTVSPLPSVHACMPYRLPVYSVRDDTVFIVPLYWAKETFPRAEFVDERPEPASRPLSFHGTIRDTQRQAIDDTLARLQREGGAVLTLPTGSGKTTCALYIASVLQKRTLIVVHKRLLLEQWRERIAQFLPRASVSVVQGAECDVSGDIVVAMVQTLISRQHEVSTFASCGMLIFDEAHHVGAPVFSQCMRRLQLMYTLGLTATPTRRDGLHRVIHWNLGAMAFEAALRERSDVEVCSFTYTSPRYALPQPVNRVGTVDSTAVMTTLVQDASRTAYLVDRVARIEPQRQVLVLSHRTAHCEALRDGLRARNVDVSLCAGKSRDTSGRVIVATYALVSEGFDLPRLDTVVFATPASDVTQAVGRILRGLGGPVCPRVIDIVDAWGSCYAQAAKRKKMYQSAGFRLLH